MALTGSLQNKRPGAGVYPGSGVAQGGQQGRMGQLHGGINAKSGGSTPGASQPRPDMRGGAAPPVPAAGHMGSGTAPPVPPGMQTLAANFKGPRTYKAPDGSVRRTAAWADYLRRSGVLLAPAKPKPGVPGAVAPVAGAPAAVDPGYTPSFALEDSDYFLQLAEAQRGFDDQLNPVNSELARLRYAGVGGKTLYDSMFENANRDFNYSVRDTRDGMHKSGLGRSGRMDRAATGLASGWLDTQRQLDESVGATAINRLETQAAQARSSFAAQQAALQMAAKARADARREAYNASLYGQTIMPEEG
jgi:hypothetical protein